MAPKETMGHAGTRNLRQSLLPVSSSTDFQAEPGIEQLGREQSSRAQPSTSPPRSSQPSSSSPSSLSSSSHNAFPYTFTAMIEADHQSLDFLAGRVVRPKLPPPSTRLEVLTTLLWRLIRHDISEELVMRPAFATYQGAAGAARADEDRQDHATLKVKLVQLYERVSDAVAMHGGLVGAEEEKVISEIKALAAEMGMHMAEESGVVLPDFEKVVERLVSLELGRRYARTLVLTPELEVMVAGERKRCFESVMDYVKADQDALKEIFGVLEEQADRGIDDGYLDRRIREEMAEIRLTFEPVVEKAWQRGRKGGGKL